MSKTGYYGDFGSFQEEQDAFNKWQEQQQEEEICLTEQVCKQDKRNGGSGIAMVSCPCPKCSPRF